MNQTLLVGRLCRHNQVRQVADHRVVDNCVAVSRKRRNKQGELLTDFIPIVAWDGLADILVNYTQKGQQVAIQGKLQSRSYINSQQQTVHLIECYVNEITLLDQRPKDTNPQEASLQQADQVVEDLVAQLH